MIHFVLLGVNEMIENFWDLFCKEKGVKLPIPESWMFGDQTKAMGDELSALVAEGKKTATCSLFQLYEIEKEAIPVVGEYDIILNGDNEPCLVTQVTKVEKIKMSDVTPELAKKEGEGDLSYDYWYQAHEDFFTNELTNLNLKFHPDVLLIWEEFEVVFRR